MHMRSYEAPVRMRLGDLHLKLCSVGDVLSLRHDLQALTPGTTLTGQ